MIVPQYVPGQWHAAVSQGYVALLEPDTPVSVVREVWNALGETQAMTRALDVLTRDGFDALRCFALVELAAGRAHAIVRGDLSVEVYSEAGMRGLSGDGVTTWAEQAVTAPKVVMVRADRGGQVAERDALPILAGVVRAAAVRVALDAEAAGEVETPPESRRSARRSVRPAHVTDPGAEPRVLEPVREAGAAEIVVDSYDSPAGPLSPARGEAPRPLAPEPVEMFGQVASTPPGRHHAGTDPVPVVAPEGPGVFAPSPGGTGPFPLPDPTSDEPTEPYRPEERGFADAPAPRLPDPAVEERSFVEAPAPHRPEATSEDRSFPGAPMPRPVDPALEERSFVEAPAPHRPEEVSEERGFAEVPMPRSADPVAGPDPLEAPEPLHPGDLAPLAFVRPEDARFEQPTEVMGMPDPGAHTELLERQDVDPMSDHDGMTILSSDLAEIRSQLPRWSADRASGYAPPPAPPAARIVLSTGLVVSLDRPVLLGRAPQVSRVSKNGLPRLVTLTSPNQDISRTHAEVRADGEHVLVTDLDSTNGVLITRPGSGPQRLHPSEPTLVEPGDVVDLGEGVTFQVERGT